jgi:hypothetical protein
MATTSTSTAIVPIQPAFTTAERLALAGFLAGYAGLTREAYALDLRQYATWCQLRDLRLFQARRADIECLPAIWKPKVGPRATITRQLCTIAGFYKYAVEEELLEHSPAAHVRRPRLDYQSHATGLDRNELGGLLVAAGLGPAPQACAHLAAGAERAEGVGGHRREHRGPRARARPPDADHHPQGRQGRDHPPRAAHRPCHRPRGRRTARGPALPDC